MPMKSYHIVILGAGGVGKSCLTAQFTHNVWIEAYDPTIEDSFKKLTVVDGQSLLLDILDTAGTEQFTSMREMYIKSGQGFLLIYSITSLQSIGDLPALHDQICRIKETTEVPLVLVGNKSDLENERVVSRGRASFLANKWGGVPWYESSAKRRVNVDEIFWDLCRQMMRLERGTEEVEVKKEKKKKHACVIL
ncbi:hypothetical protein EX30DRAFT_160918 [Ascodesmis nigricans]|uniref:Ras-domain-containing protein n=1 Tax=Ascodesmis nigricans TaxID=341454 RepID=A0A4S2MMB9_9PEZI|nr:hypothetical protein EX30DRAFT_160918 [Ascodesmis nigricans]